METPLTEPLLKRPLFTMAFSWCRCVSAGLAASFATIAFVYVSVLFYVVAAPVLGVFGVSEMTPESFAAFAGAWGALTFFGVSVTWCAYRVARNGVIRKTFTHGLVVSLAATLGVWLIYLFIIPPLRLREAILYLLLGLICAVTGGLLAQTAIARRAATYTVTRRIRNAESLDAIVIAIGEGLRRDWIAGVAIWSLDNDLMGLSALNKGQATQKKFASWTVGVEQKLGAVFDGRWSTVCRLALERDHTLLRSKNLSCRERAVWSRSEICSMLLIRLRSIDGRALGVLAVASRRSSISPSHLREILTVAQHAAVAVEGLHMRAQARKVGESSERSRIRYDMHDTVAQDIANATSLLQRACSEALVSVNPSEDSPWTKVLQAEKISKEALSEIRRVMWALGPEALETSSLPDVLAQLADEWSRKTSVHTSTTISGDPCSIDLSVQVVLIRTVQEALSNVRKHASARNVHMTLSYIDDNVVLDVCDDGVGFDPCKTYKVGPANTGGYGLEFMRERARKLGGDLVVESHPGEGTTLALELPCFGPNARFERHE